MKILGENANRDLFVGANSQLVLRTELNATLQACKSTIEAQRGEMQYNILRGIPTAATIWAGVPNQQRYRFFCIQALREIEGVVSVRRFDSDVFEDVLEYEAEILTEFSPEFQTVGSSLDAL